jgi:tetratricopeptide (TPR) repeat protein
VSAADNAGSIGRRRRPGRPPVIQLKEFRVKLRYGFVFLVCIALLAAGCGSSNKDSKSSSSKKDTSKMSKQEKAAAVDLAAKEKGVKSAKKAFDKNSKDVGACRNLAMSYVALASPASTTDPKNPPPLPKDRDKNLKKSVSTLETCTKIDPKDRDVKQMLASTYMATNKYDKAAKLLKELATTSRGAEQANAYYAWGLAASNAQQLPDAIAAWQKFVSLSPAKDPRVKQVQQSIKALQDAQKQQSAAKK